MKEFESSTEYKPVIGFEIHVELATKSKMFGPAPNNPDEKQPNRNIDEIVVAEPGTLPVANKEAVRLAAMVGLALNCQIDEWSKFDRKHYFYPDLPKGYQISQYDQPISKNGYLDIEILDIGGQKKIKRVRITRAHLEEDAGKNIHPEGLSYSLVDYNRAGCPLLEIVSEPDIESGEQGRAYLEEIQRIVRYLGVSAADMEKGLMRCEPSISVRKPGETTLPKYKVEVKNINSISFAEAAINYEIARQTEMLKEGKTPKQVTMGWHEKEGITVEQRSKEEANDYRYFPEPDLPVLQFTKEYLDKLRAEMPELPAQKRARFEAEYKLDAATIDSLINWKELTFYFEDVVSEIDEWMRQESGLDRKQMIKIAANWCLQDYAAQINELKLEANASFATPENFAELIKLVNQGKVSNTAAKRVLTEMVIKGGEPLSIINDLGLHQVSDEGAIESSIDKVIAANPKAVTDYKAGQEKSFGFLVGQTMKELKGKGNPQVINELLRKKLK